MGASVNALVGRGPGRTAHDRGELAEHRVHCAALRLSEWWWFVSAERVEQFSARDKIGWDIIVHTVDAGRVILQVKSSEREAEKFIRHGRTLRLVAPIHVIVARPEDDDATLFGRVLGTCLRARLEALELGLTADDPRVLKARAA